ncbi:hypothetical protein ABZ478_12420 [Streptomyces sp. NPDC005706]
MPTALRACATDPTGVSPAVGMALPTDGSLDADARQPVAVSKVLRTAP